MTARRARRPSKSTPPHSPPATASDDLAAISCLPDELLQRVFAHLQRQSLPAVRSTCRHWRNILDNGLERLQLVWSDSDDARSLCNFKNLQVLVLQKHRPSFLATTLRPLAQCSKLAKVHMSGNFSSLEWLSCSQTLRRLFLITDRNYPSITDLQPLAACTQLSILSLAGCISVSDISPLASCILLQEVDLTATDIQDAGPLASCPQLQRLSLCDCRRLTAISELVAHRNFEVLNLSDTCIVLQELGDLSAWSKLQQLDLSYTKGGNSLCSLSACVGLQALCINGFAITDLAEAQALAYCTALTRIVHRDWMHESDESLWVQPPVMVTGACSALRCLELVDAPIDDISSLASCTLLELLRLAGSPVSDLSPLAVCQELLSLDISYTMVRDLTPLTNCSKLKKLNIINTRVNDVRVIKSCHGLRRLLLGPLEGGYDCWFRTGHYDELGQDAFRAACPYLKITTVTRSNVYRLDGIPGSEWGLQMGIAEVDKDCLFVTQDGTSSVSDSEEDW